MSRLYGALLELEDRNAPGVPASIDDVAQIAFDWAGVSGVTGAVEGRFPANKGGDVIAERFELGATGTLAWRLAFQHADSAEPDVRWRTLITAVEGATTRASVELHRFSVDGTVRSVEMSVDPPRVVREFLKSTSPVKAVDAGIECPEASRTVHFDAVTRFIEFACSADRRLPIVVFTEGGGRGDVNYEKLQGRLAGVAHVLILDSDASSAISRSVQPGITPWGGWTRIWWPKFSRDTPKGDAPWWNPGTPVWRLVSEIERAVIVASAQSFSGLPEFQEVRSLVVARRWSELEEKREARAAQLAEQVDESASTENLRAENLLLTEEIDRVNKALDKTLEDWLVDCAGLEEQLQLAIEERDTAKSELAEVLATTESDTVRNQVRDEAQAFRDDMNVYYESWPEDDKTDFPLGQFQFFEEFFITVKKIDRRQKTLELCTNIAANRMHAVADVHALMNGPTKKIHRVSDGANAMRADVQAVGAGARRMHYWRLKSGDGIEFAKCGFHEDFDIPEHSPRLY